MPYKDPLANDHDPLVNTLRKVLAIQFLSGLDAVLSSPRGGLEVEDVVKFESTGATGFSVRGSARLTIAKGVELDFPRNPRDIDIDILGGNNYSQRMASKSALGVIIAGATRSGIDVKNAPIKQPIREAANWILRSKKTYEISDNFSPEDRDSIVKNAELYGLTDRDVEILQVGRDAGNVKVSMTVGVSAANSKPDLPAVESVLAGGKVLVDNPLTALVGKLQACNYPWVRIGLHPIDLYNLNQAINDGQGIGPDDVTMLKSNLFNDPKSQYRERLAIHRIADTHDFGNIGVDRNTVGFPEPTEKHIDGFLADAQKYYDRNIIGRMPNRDEAREILETAYQISVQLFDASRKSWINRAIEESFETAATVVERGRTTFNDGRERRITQIKPGTAADIDEHKRQVDPTKDKTVD